MNRCTTALPALFAWSATRRSSTARRLTVAAGPGPSRPQTDAVLGPETVTIIIQLARSRPVLRLQLGPVTGSVNEPLHGPGPTDGAGLSGRRGAATWTSLNRARRRALAGRARPRSRYYAALVIVPNSI